MVLPSCKTPTPGGGTYEFPQNGTMAKWGIKGFIFVIRALECGVVLLAVRTHPGAGTYEFPQNGKMAKWGIKEKGSFFPFVPWKVELMNFHKMAKWQNGKMGHKRVHFFHSCPGMRCGPSCSTHTPGGGTYEFPQNGKMAKWGVKGFILFVWSFLQYAHTDGETVCVCVCVCSSFSSTTSLALAHELSGVGGASSPRSNPCRGASSFATPSPHFFPFFFCFFLFFFGARLVAELL